MADNVTGRFTGRSVVRKAGRMILVVISILLAGLLILAGVLALRSPGKPNPILGEDGKPLAGSISEKIFVEINGVQQGMFIQSRDAANPVLLLLHGGPGMPEYFLTKHYPTGSGGLLYGSVVGAARRRAFVRCQPPTGDDHRRAIDIRYAAGDELPALPASDRKRST